MHAATLWIQTARDKRQTSGRGEGFSPVEDELGMSEKKQTGPGDRPLRDEW